MDNNEINGYNIAEDIKASSSSTTEKIVGFLKKLGVVGKYVMMFITFLLALLVFTRIFVGVTPSSFKETKKDLKEQQGKIDSVLQSQKFLTERMFELEAKQIFFQESIDKNNSLVVETNKSIDKLKRIYNEKIKSVNNFTIRDLDSFFAIRYKEYYNK